MLEKFLASMQLCGVYYIDPSREQIIYTFVQHLVFMHYGEYVDSVTSFFRF